MRNEQIKSYLCESSFLHLIQEYYLINSVFKKEFCFQISIYFYNNNEKTLIFY